MISFLFRLLICIGLLHFAKGVHAQESKTFKDLIFVDARAGAFQTFSDAGMGSVKLELGAGWRATKNHGIGLSFRDETSAGAYNNNSMKGIGVDYRFDWSQQVLAKAGYGKVLTATEGTESTMGVYLGGGTYSTFSADYVFKGGFTLGIWATIIQNIRFDDYSYNFDFGITSDVEYIFDREINEKFASFGIAIGYSWPRRQGLSSEERKARKGK